MTNKVLPYWYREILGPLKDYDASEIEQYAEVFRRGIAEVGNVVNDVNIEAA